MVTPLLNSSPICRASYRIMNIRLSGQRRLMLSKWARHSSAFCRTDISGDHHDVVVHGTPSLRLSSHALHIIISAFVDVANIRAVAALAGVLSFLARTIQQIRRRCSRPTRHFCGREGRLSSLFLSANLIKLHSATRQNPGLQTHRMLII